MRRCAGPFTHLLLCCTEGVQTGRRRHRPRIAFDVGVVCPQAASHRAAAAAEGRGAAEAYTAKKCAHNSTEERCEAAGLEFQPLVFESLGGMAAEAEEVLKSLGRRVAVNTKTPFGEVAQRLWCRLSVDLQRAGHKAVARRCAGQSWAARRSVGDMGRDAEGLAGVD